MKLTTRRSMLQLAAAVPLIVLPVQALPVIYPCWFFTRTRPQHACTTPASMFYRITGPCPCDACAEEWPPGIVYASCPEHSDNSDFQEEVRITLAEYIAADVKY